MDSVVIKRSAQTAKDAEREAKRKRKAQERAAMMRDLGRDEEVVDDELDLATLLNVLDGVRETPGRILILSTNYPERLDEALLRPGRFDIILEFAKHSVDVLRRHMENFYDCALTQEQIDELRAGNVGGKWTPAEVSQILFKHLGDVGAAIRELVERQPADLFRFSRIGGATAADAAATVSSSKPIIIESWGGNRNIPNKSPLGGLCAVNDYVLPQNEVSSISTASSEEEINSFLPACELQNEIWDAAEQKRSAFGLPKRTGFPAGYNGVVIRSPNALSPSSALQSGPPKGKMHWTNDLGQHVTGAYKVPLGAAVPITATNEKTLFSTLNEFSPSLASFDDGNKYAGTSL